MSLRILIVLILSLTTFAGNALAINRSRPFHPRSKSVMTGFAAVGNIVGNRAKYLDAKDQYVYGLGFGTEHYPHPSFGLGGELRQMWNSGTGSGSIIYTIYSTFRFTPGSTKSLYLKIGAGSASSKSYYNSRTQVKIALGLLTYNSRRFNANSGRIELSFNRQPDDAGLNYLALEFGLGLPLF